MKAGNFPNGGEKTLDKGRRILVTRTAEGIKGSPTMEKHDRVFSRMTNRGTVSLIVREQYLRDDIPCLAIACTSCRQTLALSADHPELLVARLQSDASHYLVPDTQVLVTYLEILEALELKNIIVSQTSLQWIQNNERQRLTQRIRAMVADPRKQSVVFNNENFATTFTQRKKEETLAQRDFRALYGVACYYRSHLKQAVPVVLISSAKDAPEVVVVEGVLVLSMKLYMKRFWSHDQALMDLYNFVTEALLREEAERGEKEALGANEYGYTDHLSEDVLEAEVKSGLLFRGRLNVSEVNAQDEGFVSTSSDFGDVLVSGMSDRNRAVHGDVVVVEVFPESRWKAPLRLLRRKNETAAAAETRSSLSEAKEGKIPTGRVVGVLQRNWRPYVATLQEGDQQSGHILAIPMDFKVPKIRIRINEISRLQNQRLVVRIDSWPVNSQYPAGHLIKALGECNQKETEVSAILVEHGIEVPPFSDAVVASLPRDTPQEPWKITPQDIADRRDLRKSHFICSIDPLGSEDIDDALSVRLLQNGNFELGVHIADVTHFIQPESPCDVEGRARGTSVYLSDRRYNMLPAVLSERLCSLRGEVDRFAVSVLSELTPAGEVVKHWFGKTLIRSAKEMYYEQAQAILEQQPADHEYLKKLDASFLTRARVEIPRLALIAEALRNKRLEAGAIELESAEIRFNFDQNKGIAGLVAKTQKEIHKIVAECMIFANGVVASQIAKVFPSCALLRKHPKPVQNQFTSLVKCVTARGFQITTTSNKTLGESLDSLAEKCDPEVMQFLRTMTTTVMAEAEYFSTGSSSVEDFQHYGLGLGYYTHFTSPIRRYADCIVHWQLLASVRQEMGLPIDLRLKNTVLKPSWVVEITEHLNAKNRNAKHAQQDSTELFETLYIMNETANGKTMEMTGIIYDIRANGFMVYLPKLGLRTILYVRDKAGSLILSPRFLGQKNGPVEAVPAAGTLTTTDVSATISLATGGSHEFKVLDKVKVALSLSPSHAHRASVVVDLVSREKDALPAKGASKKSLIVGGGASPAKPGKDNQEESRIVSKGDMIKAIDRAEQEKKGLEVKASDPEKNAAEFRQTPDSRSMYAVLEKMKAMSIH